MIPVYLYITDFDSFTLDIEDDGNFDEKEKHDDIHFSKFLNLMPNYNKEILFMNDKSNQPLLDEEKLNNELTSFV